MTRTRRADGGSRGRGAGLIVAALGAVLAIAPSACAAVSEPEAAGGSGFDYLHIEANEGGSSGGHVAVRFGHETFHFQQEQGGLLRLRRDESIVFDIRYALLGNRPMHAQRIAVAPGTVRQLRDGFALRALVQDAQYARLAALDADVALLALWVERGRAPARAAGVPIRAAGFFDGGAPASGTSSTVRTVRAAIADRYGADFLPRRIAALRAELAAWHPAAVREPAPALSPDRTPPWAETASEVLAARLELLTALEVIAAAPPLAPGALRTASGLPPLDPCERDALAGFARRLRHRLVELAASPRPDGGYSLLLGLARLAALEASLESGELVVVDSFAAASPPALLPAGAGERRAFLEALGSQLRAAVSHARDPLRSGSPLRESDYSALESTVNRWLEIDGGQRGGPLRVDTGARLPDRTATRRDLVAAPLPAATARRELAHARRTAANYRRALAGLYDYDLIARNCVTEVFATVAAALATEAPRTADPARAALGEPLDTAGTLNFIPAMSAAAVARTWPVAGRTTHPSYRQQRLRALAAGGMPAWRLALRESNTLTATTYHPSPYDSIFLFFTDGATPVRPLLGLANLLYGIAAGTVGLATWPADGGRRLRAGFRGAFFSLPELAFLNIRKGSMGWVEAEMLAGGDAGTASVTR